MCQSVGSAGIATATAKRDFSDLADRIDFVGSGKAGYDALAQGQK